MSCCGPSRRRVLGALGLAALLPVMGAVWPGSVAAQPNPILAGDLEVVTVTDRSAILTWTTRAPDAAGRLVPVATDGEVRLIPADSPRAPVPVWAAQTRTPFHYAQVDGLEPGRRYRFEAWSQGVRAVPAPHLITHLPDSPELLGEFSTLVPPPGRLLRTVALANDVHYGEEVSGLVVGDLPPGFRQEPGLPPYPEVMLTALLDDLRRPDRDAGMLLLAGDLTSEATPAETHGVRAHLDAWGTAGADYLAVRGNHDRPHVGDDYRACPAVPGSGTHFDCWAQEFGPRQQLVEQDLGGLRLLGLETSELDGSGGTIERPQLDHVREILRADPDRPTLVFGHHPVTVESGLTNTAGPGFVLNRRDSAELQALYERAPGVFLHHSGHTHRNRRTRPDAACAVEFLEVAAVKEYPGGYSLVRIYEGGYMLNFYKTRTEHARRWSTMTRGEYFGLFPDYTLGTFADRNHVVARDFSGLR
ncbi:phosphohydrolase [Nocardia cyriacigeorgica]|uniref:Phosphohydrolase n=2 Tax=Nocardia cyriacigeorgica TaxID=135487 RepID=A0A6P1CHP4_9NOCA|nr:metallophosphoesterase [Nocardia cyriacigeorgica]MBF6425456.1 metallophosphoesterase [Nocardia cyriacigeorgica]NEW31908.1 phosphohydrolase [Nocardia cyriacigeorgica]CCF61922.1 Putative phosphohydrolase [Nocardia cyriacigeorgica GUH-2]